MPTYEAEIVREARTVARLQRQRRELRRKLRDVETELRTAKRTLRKIVGARETARDLMDQTPPLHAFGEIVRPERKAK